MQNAIIEMMTLPELLTWRRVCKAVYADVTVVLRRRLSGIIKPFFDNTPTFLRHLTDFGAVLGGIAALSFILQDSTLRSDVLQIYVGRIYYQPFVLQLGSCPAHCDDIVAVGTREPPRQFGAERDISSMTTLRLRSGRSVLVYQASTSSGCSTLGRSPCSALMNFVSEHAFACGYPGLTLRRRALLSDVRITTLSDVDCIVLRALVQAGFQLAPHAGAWEEYRHPSTHPSLTSRTACLREQYVCPQQARFFGDKGSLTDVLDPLLAARDDVPLQQLPPFGPTVVWRFLSTFRCDHRCDTRDPLLHEWLVSSPIITLPDPFPPSQAPSDRDRGRTRRRPTQAGMEKRHAMSV
ncbi:hypothetical protein C8Q76DRAFT_614408 [Earliella scabrosa]|nr:hypothetical protein C8Q76DRAFT_614408 [Earliella scabrosa]